jgi:hypothetical protein
VRWDGMSRTEEHKTHRTTTLTFLFSNSSNTFLKALLTFPLGPCVVFPLLGEPGPTPVPVPEEEADEDDVPFQPASTGLANATNPGVIQFQSPVSTFSACSYAARSKVERSRRLCFRARWTPYRIDCGWRW